MFKPAQNRMIPTDSLRSLAQGSMEHLTLRIDDAIAENVTAFIGENDAQVARVATFDGYVVVGAEDGRYFNAKYEDKAGSITFSDIIQIDVPVIDSENISEYVNRLAYDAASSLMEGKLSVDEIVALMTIDESFDDEEDSDLASMVAGIIESMSPWKVVFNDQRDTIISQVGSVAESIKNSELTVKYTSLYDGSLPEERFHEFLGLARSDCAMVGKRLEALEARIDQAYIPFAEKFDDSKTLSAEDKDTVGQFISFSEGVAEEVHDLREHVRIAVDNEQCAMCLGQIYDRIAESLTDYEIAGSFVECMSTRFVTAQ